LAVHYFNKGELISGPFPPASPYNNPEINIYPYRPDLAIGYLGKIGCRDSDGDGILELNGQPLEFVLFIEAETQIHSSIQGVAESIEDYLGEIGIKITVKNLESHAFTDRVKIKRDYDMVISGWIFDEQNNISSLFRTNGENNFISYSNPEVDKYIDYVNSEFDEEKKRLVNYKLHEILQLDSPYCFLWTLDKYAALHKKIRGTEYIHPFKFFSFIGYWYIPRELQ
jgi:peptide/nickel transport system substrate-binding protein